METLIERFLALVEEEATNLRRELTDVEKERFKETTVDSNDMTKCIYGIATSHCFSRRTEELILKCVPLMIDPETSNSYNHNLHDSFESVSKHTNGIPRRGIFKPIGRFINYLPMKHMRKKFTPVENYIYIHRKRDKYIKGLVDYIIGKRKTFKAKRF